MDGCGLSAIDESHPLFGHLHAFRSGFSRCLSLLWSVGSLRCVQIIEIQTFFLRRPWDRPHYLRGLPHTPHSKPWVPHTQKNFKTRLQHKQRTIVQNSGRLGFRRSKQKKLAGDGAVYRWLGVAMEASGVARVRRSRRIGLHLSWVAVCMAGRAGTDNGPEAG